MKGQGKKAKKQKEKPSPTRNFVEWVVILGAALLLAVVVKTYLLQAFFIPSPSMVPTLQVQDRVLVNKLSYRLGPVDRGDVVVFERPENVSGDIKDLIKRVVAVEGDTIESQGNTLYVNGQPLREPYVNYVRVGDVMTQAIGAAVEKQTIPDGKVYVMGDNRTNSTDSRFALGPVDEDAIIGRAFVKIWPLGSLGLL